MYILNVLDNIVNSKSGNGMPIGETLVQRALHSANQEDSSDCTKR